MRKAAVVVFAVAVLVPSSGHTSYICTDARGKVSIQDRPCAEKKASTTNVPVQAKELSDRNSLETVDRFYKAMSERDSAAASQFLADTFTSEVRRPNEQPTNDDKASLTADLRTVLSAVKTYTAKTDCRVVKRATAAYSLSCQVDEQGILGAEALRVVSDQTVTIVLDRGLVKIGRIVADERNLQEQGGARAKRN